MFLPDSCRRAPSRLARTASLSTTAFVLAACSLDVSHLADKVPPYRVVESAPRNLIERALAACPERTDAEATRCVKSALTEASITVPQLIAQVPGCAAGRECRYTYTTVDRLGFIPAMAADYVVHWGVSFDLTKPGRAMGDIPVTAKQVP